MGYSDVSGLPAYFTKGHNRDSEWHERARCRGASADPGHPFYQAWYARENRYHTMPDGTRIPGVEMVGYALNECGMCPAQWDCARWAVEVSEDYGTWAMAFDDLRWLKTQADAISIIESARSKGLTVQVTVRSRRARRTRRVTTIAS